MVAFALATSCHRNRPLHPLRSHKSEAPICGLRTQCARNQSNSDRSRIEIEIGLKSDRHRIEIGSKSDQNDQNRIEIGSKIPRLAPCDFSAGPNSPPRPLPVPLSQAPLQGNTPPPHLAHQTPKPWPERTPCSTLHPPPPIPLPHKCPL